MSYEASLWLKYWYYRYKINIIGAIIAIHSKNAVKRFSRFSVATTSVPFTLSCLRKNRQFLGCLVDNFFYCYSKCLILECTVLICTRNALSNGIGIKQMCINSCYRSKTAIFHVSGKDLLPVQIILQHTLQYTKLHTIKYSFQKHVSKEKRFYSTHKNSTKSHFCGMLIKTMKKHDIYKKNVTKKTLVIHF